MLSRNGNSLFPRLGLVIAFAVLIAPTLSFAAGPEPLTWTQLQTAANFPARAGFAAAYDPVSKRVVAFGGYDASGVIYNDTWVFDGASWQQLTIATPPSARFGSAIAYDRTIKKLVMFGGAFGLSRLNDTWLFDGATLQWTQAHPQHTPPQRVHPMPFTDPIDGHADMFGGQGRQFYSRSTYKWIGTDWILATPSPFVINSPYPRAGGISVVDPAHKNVLLFGGISDNWVTQNTWTWDGKWAQQAPSTQPDNLYFTTGAFYPTLHKAVVFGGGNGGVDEDGTWAWTGGNWTLLAPIASPPAREQFSTVWDAASGQLLIFGGTNFTTGEFFSDTWVLSGK